MAHRHSKAQPVFVRMYSTFFSSLPDHILRVYEENEISLPSDIGVRSCNALISFLLWLYAHPANLKVIFKPVNVMCAFTDMKLSLYLTSVIFPFAILLLLLCI